MVICLPMEISLLMYYAQKKFINYPSHPDNTSVGGDGDLGV
jgi:hypothetical protein